jgi:hypothetical protein
MDNNTVGGSGANDDFFGFIPPNMMFPKDSTKDNTFSSKEEMERYFYHLEHDNEFHITNKTQE